jgi:hypothetical protein
MNLGAETASRNGMGRKIFPGKRSAISARNSAARAGQAGALEYVSIPVLPCPEGQSYT